MPSHYLADVIGSGTDADPFRPAVADHVAFWQAQDGRTDPTQAGQAMLVSCDPTDDEHTAVIGDGKSDYIGQD